jgi:hypothetical protein
VFYRKEIVGDTKILFGMKSHGKSTFTCFLLLFCTQQRRERSARQPLYIKEDKTVVMFRLALCACFAVAIICLEQGEFNGKPPPRPPDREQFPQMIAYSKQRLQREIDVIQLSF